MRRCSGPLAAFAVACAGLVGAGSATAQVVTTYAYDAQGQVTSVVRPTNSIAYGYDAAGNRIALVVTYPAPGAAPGAMTIPFGGSASLALPISGQFTSAAIDALPSKGSVSINGTTVTYTAAGNNYGVDSFSYHAVGPGGNSGVQIISVTIATPPAPGAGDGLLNVGYSSSASLAAPITGVATGVVIDSSPAKGAVSTSGTSFTYTAAWPNYGADSFTYHATGPGGASAMRTINVTIANGAAPSAANVSATTPFNTPVTITYPVGGDYATMVLDSGPAHGALSSLVLTPNVGYQQTYTPAANYFGADSWTFHATSPFGNSPVRTASVTTMGAPNHAPTCTNLAIGPINAPPYANITVTITAAMLIARCTDSDGDTLSVASPGTPFDLHPTSGTITVPYTVSDGHGGTGGANVVVTRN